MFGAVTAVLLSSYNTWRQGIKSVKSHSEVPSYTLEREGSGWVLSDLKGVSKQCIPPSLKKKKNHSSPTASVENGLVTKIIQLKPVPGTE